MLMVKEKSRRTTATARKTPKKSSKTAKKSHKTALQPRLIVLFAAIPAITVLCFALIPYLFQSRVTPADDPTDTKYYFTDSKYKDISSKFVERKSSFEQTSIEYPVTKNQRINDTIAATIDEKDAEFRELLGARPSQLTEPFTNLTSYQVSHNSDDFLSITVSIKQDTHGAHPANYSRFWTFDKHTGEVVTLKNLLGDSTENLSRISQLIQQKAAEIVRKKDENYSVDPIPDEQLTNFIATENIITLPYEPGSIAVYAAGDITVSIDVAEIADYLQNDTARKIFDVPKPAPPAEPAPKPIAPQTSSGSCSDKCVALTFDDGPGIHTSRLLDTLDKYNAKATFFVVGEKVAARQDILQQQIARGHQIGNHSWSHPDLTKLSTENIQSELAHTNDAIKAATGRAPTVMRPPYGAINQNVSQQLRANGMSAILWSVDTRDWADRDSQIVCTRAVSGARSGAIILFHDIHPTSVDAIPCVLDALTKQGYTFVTIDTLFGGGTQPGRTYFSAL